ncbi:hypothetical protein Cni_G05151 [Canna indica]|uniref:Complex III subunit VI n=1 Tax=Canna indica TaxID=4628 RepID=A0AAQ3Q567_9LILI|nr:hypothetical protein Cni_G05151 [Canna indica]
MTDTQHNKKSAAQELLLLLHSFLCSTEEEDELHVAFRGIQCAQFWLLLALLGCSKWKAEDWADVEPIDPKQHLEEASKAKCVRPLHAYQACVDRIKGDDTGHKHCTGQYFDYWMCIDNSVAPKLFEKLK